ncbi:hypothetical protein FQR65_LT09123 [Abscondita terminalis]|nr:hypothetical protein FQR65_LT09123 [Abscondita terminalis]
MITTTLIIASILCILAIKYIKWLLSYWERKGVPTLKPVFLLGNAKSMLMGKENVGHSLFKATEYFKRQKHRFFGYYFAIKPIFVPVDIDLIKKMLITDFEHFTDRPFASNDSEPLGEHLFALKDELPNDDKTVEIKDLSSKLTIDILASCAFGIEANSLKTRNSDFSYYTKAYFHTSFKQTLIRLCTIMYPGVLKTFNAYSIPEDVSKYFVSLAGNTIKYRETNNVYRNDFMHLLIQIKNNVAIVDDEIGDLKKTNQKEDSLSLNEISAQCFVFLVAGYESSSSAVSFCLYELCLNKRLQEKARAEIINAVKDTNGEITYDILSSTPYIEKTCTKPYRIPESDIVLEKDAICLISLLSLHYDPQMYPNPQEFDPERFSEQNINKRHSLSWVPFGDGPRICIAYQFGLMQTKLTVASLLLNYDFSLNPKTKVPLVIEPRAIQTMVNGGIWLDYTSVTKIISWITYRRVGLLTVELDYLPSSWITYRRVGLLTVELDYLPSSWITYRRVGLLTVELDYLPSSWITYRRVGLLTVELDYLPSSWITYRRVGLLTVELDYLPSSWITYRRVGLLTVELDYLPSSWITYRRVGLLTVELDYLPSSWITYRRVGLLTVELDYLPSSWITYRRVGLLTVELDYLPSSWITYRRVGLLTVELDYLPSSWITYRRVGLLTVELDYLPSSWITYRRVGLLTVELDYLPSSWITYRRVGLLTVELDYLPSSWITYRRVGLLTVELDYLPSSWITYRRVGLLTVELDYLPSSWITYRRVGLLTVELDYLPSSWITYRRVGLLTVELDYLPSSWITYRRVGLLTVELDYLPSSWITYRRVGLLTVELDYLPSSWITYRRVGLLTVELDYLPSSWITYRRVGLLTVELDYLPSSWITYRRVGLLTVELDYLPSSWITYRRVGLLTVELDYLPSSWITYRRVGLLTVELDYLPSSWITYRRVGLLTVELDYLPSLSILSSKQ